MALLTPALWTFVAGARVARMATVDARGRPAVLPICFCLQGDALFSVIDEKPKRVEGRRLQRLRNLAAHPDMAVVVDVWDEDWTRLAWVMLRGEGSVLDRADDLPQVLAELRAKYPQYTSMALEARPLIRMTLTGVRHWGRIPGA